MLLILSPATTMDETSPVLIAAPTQPRFLAEAAALAGRLRRLSEAQLAELMGLSAPLAALNAARYAAWRRAHTPENGRPAILAFRGSVYQGLDADSLPAAALDFAQTHLRILSGLYGVLRPLDLVQPHRLELKTPLSGPGWDTLGQFWGGKITNALNAALAESGGEVLLNLASGEYGRAVQKRRLNGRFLDVQFKERRGGQFRTIGTFAKQARGLLARFVLMERVTCPDDLRRFAAAGYAFHADLSSANCLTFTR